jgi:DNA primase
MNMPDAGSCSRFIGSPSPALDAPDGDKAGGRMAEETLAMLAPYRFVRWVMLPEGQQPTDVSKEELYIKLPAV